MTTTICVFPEEVYEVLPAAYNAQEASEQLQQGGRDTLKQNSQSSPPFRVAEKVIVILLWLARYPCQLVRTTI